MGEGITDRELRDAFAGGASLIRRAILVEREDGGFCAIVRIAGAIGWRCVVLAYRSGARRWVDCRRALRALRGRYGYRGPCWFVLHDDPLLARITGSPHGA